MALQRSVGKIEIETSVYASLGLRGAGRSRSWGSDESMSAKIAQLRDDLAKEQRYNWGVLCVLA